MAAYPQSVTYTRTFYLYLTSDHVTPATGKTVTVTVSKAGAAFGAAAGAVAEVGNGLYKIDLTTADTNTLGDLSFYGTATACDAVQFVDQVIDAAKGLGAPSNLDATISSRLAPTVAARTLDVSATGEAGIDWANIGSPTTAVNLSATNIDVDQVVASVSGAVGSVTGLTAANLDVAVSSRLATAGYTAPDNTSISTILTRTDVATSTRLATSGYTAPDNASITAIKAKTDSLTFNVAGYVDANIRYVNSIAVAGSGTSASPWGP